MSFTVLCEFCGWPCNSRGLLGYRVLTHIQNPKKPECKLYILNSGSVRALPNDVVQELDELDNIAIREARKQGHTHPRVKAPARRADGKCIGCART